MKNQVLLILFSFLFVLGACKKDKDPHVCPEVDVPYQSIRAFGDTANMVRVQLFKKTRISDTLNSNTEGAEGAGCLGVFLLVTNGVAADSNIYTYKVSNELSDSILNDPNYRFKEWLVNVKYLGVGIGCYVTTFLKDPVPGGVAYKDDVELVEVTHIEPFL